eukprot:jgi/Psemu1/67521/estExt_Genemark1.C_3330025
MNFFLVLVLVTVNLKFGACSPSAETSSLNGNGYKITVSEPTMTWSGFRLDMDYLLSSPLGSDKVEYAVYSDRECKGGAISVDEIEPSMIETSDNSVQLSLLFNPQKIHGARYVSFKDDYAVIEFCTRVWITQPGTVPSPISPPRDNYVIVKADLKDLNGILNILDDNSPHWGVDIFRCDSQDRLIVEPSPAVKNGQTLRLCLKPTKDTTDDGIYLALVNSFRFERDGIVQHAMESYGPDEVTEVTCKRGSTLCVVESVLSNDFYFSEGGEVKAMGSVYLQVGRAEDGRKARLLRRSVQFELGPSSTNTRSLALSEEGTIMGKKSVAHVVSIERSHEVYSAEAFRCDAKNDPIPEEYPLHRNEQIKICIQPDQQARRAGVRMNSINSFSYKREIDGKAQMAVDSFGKVSSDDKTELHCTSGAQQCFFNSTLNDAFFSFETRMVVNGHATLQFGELDDDSEHEDLWFAGKSGVNAFFNVVESELAKGKKQRLTLSDDQNGGKRRVSMDTNAQRRESQNLKGLRLPSYLTGISEKFEFGSYRTQNAHPTSSISGSTAADSDRQQLPKKPSMKNARSGESKRKLRRDTMENDLATVGSVADSKMSSSSSKAKKNTDKTKRRKSRISDAENTSLMADDISKSSAVTRNSDVSKKKKKKSRDSFSVDDVSRSSASVVTKNSDASKKERRKSRTLDAKKGSLRIDDYTDNSVVTKSSDASKKERRKSRTLDAKKGSLRIDDYTDNSVVTKDSDDAESDTPRAKDICFEAEEHPGTQAFLGALEKTLEDLGPISYSPTVYKHIKRQLSGRNFFVCDVSKEERNADTTNKQYDWRKIERRELIEAVRLYYDAAKVAEFEEVNQN